jgi:serine/threonine protein kinase/Tol biopolymer transport system component
MITHDRWQRIKEIFQSAQEKTPTERLEFLDEVCGDDESIREEVEALLTADDSNDDFLSAPAYEFAAGMLSDEEPGVSEFSNGQKVGRYTILCPLGAGGMGQIYLAQDEQLGRKIALKMIARAFATDPRRVLRFEQEARAASALNHPNVCVIHETGVTDNNRHFIAMEYIQGITLRDKLTRGPIALVEALNIARQVADALGAAHAAGIVHRDIKPENIMLRPDGYVKVLDFGLAKLTEILHEPDPEPRVGISHASTTVRTESGTLMGTVKYMSPEQLGEMELDERTDIWSLGVVLYEMLTRTTPFEARTPNGTIASIVAQHPPVLELSETLPGRFRDIVEKAMDKDRATRYQTVQMLATDLNTLQRELEREGDERFATAQTTLRWYPPVKSYDTHHSVSAPIFTRLKSQAISTAEFLLSEIRSHKAAALFTGVSGVLALLVVLPFVPRVIRQITSGGGNVRQVAAERQPLPSKMRPQRSVTNAGTSVCLAISADGRFVAHAEEQYGKQRLMVTSTATFGTSVVVPPEEVEYFGLTFSPDNNYLYFTRREKEATGILYRLALPGATPVKVKEGVDSPISLSPQADRFAFVREDSTHGRYDVVLSDIGGTQERTVATRKFRDDFSIYGLAWSPDGNFVVCPAGEWNNGHHIKLIAIDVNTGTEKVIGQQSWFSVYQLAWQNDMSGLIISARDRMLAPHQLWRVTYPAGDVEKLTSDLSDYRSVSLSGEKIATVKTDWKWRMWVSPVDGSSAPTAIASGGGLTYGISWTSNGKIIYSAVAQDRLNLSRVDPDGSNPVQLTVDSGDNYSPAASPDGKFIVFTSTRAGSMEIYRLNAETGNDIKRLTDTDGNAYPVVSADNQWVAYDHVAEVGRSVWKVPLAGGEPVRVAERYRMPAFSPDGQMIATRFDRKSGTRDIAIFPAGGGAPLHRINVPVLEWQRIGWLDNQTLTFIKNVGGISNIWSYDLASGTSKQLTNFNGDQIFAYAWSPDFRQLVSLRGLKTSDVTLIGE